MRTSGARLRDRLGKVSAGLVLGRQRELDLLLGQLAEGGAVLSFVHGMGGIGKTSLLAAVEPRLIAAGARVIHLDGRSIEPSPRGFIAELGRLLGAPDLGDVEHVAAELERDSAQTVLLIDEYDHLRLLDSWLRQTLLPALPERTRFIVAGRFAPNSAWLTSPGWSDAVLALRLEALDDATARELLARRGVADAAMAPLLALARGTPLALTLVSMRSNGAELSLGVNRGAVLSALAQRCAEDLEPRLRQAVEAASLVRRATRPLLEAMIEQPCDDALLRELLTLPFVEYTDEGLTLHESVRQALAARLKALDPERHRRHRAAAWRALERMLNDSTPTGPHAWRLTADVLFVVEHPEIREAFFPTTESALVIDGATPADHGELFAIVKRHEPAPLWPVFEAWWRLAGSAFRVVRGANGVVLGFFVAAPADTLPAELSQADPLLAAWQDDLHAGPGSARGALFMRRSLSAAGGEAPGEVRSAIWLDVKRAYIERPAQWALYVASRSSGRLLPLVSRLGFQAVPLAHLDESTLRLEFGALGIWSWLRGLVNATELGGAALEPGATPSGVGWSLDTASRGLLVDGQLMGLSALEYQTLAYLLARPGEVVSRDELLERVWQQRNSGSNVVDAVVRLLRKKLGVYSTELETVRGHGYRVAKR